MMNWITFSGPDAKDFLHRLTTVNVKLLPLNQGTPGCFLTPQGKFRAYFKLWHLAQNEYAFEFDAGTDGAWKGRLLSLIDQYTFGEKLTIGAGTDQCMDLFDGAIPSMPSLVPGATLLTEDGLRYCHQGDRDYGRAWVTVWGPANILNAWKAAHLSALENASPSPAQIEEWRVRAAHPKIDAEITEAVSPLEVGLQDAIAENKGCYPGQEVIEKIISLGAPPRRLAQISGECRGEAGSTLPCPGDSILNCAQPAIEVGTFTSVVEQASDGRGSKKFIALGLIKKMYAKEDLDVSWSAHHRGNTARIARVV